MRAHWRVLTIIGCIAALLAVDAGTAMGQESLICRKRDKKLDNDGGRTVLGPKDDVVNAGGGKDILIGGKGDDILNGGKGNDVVIGGPGNDIVCGGLGNDRVEGSQGKDDLTARRTTTS